MPSSPSRPYLKTVFQPCVLIPPEIEAGSGQKHSHHVGRKECPLRALKLINNPKKTSSNSCHTKPNRRLAFTCENFLVDAGKALKQGLSSLFSLELTSSHTNVHLCGCKSICWHRVLCWYNINLFSFIRLRKPNNFQVSNKVIT